MEKQIRDFEVPFCLDWVYSVSIEKLRQDLDELEKLGATRIEIEPCDDWGVPSISMTALCTRLETDEEFDARVNEEQRRKQERINRDLKEFERLKLKYGK